MRSRRRRGSGPARHHSRWAAVLVVAAQSLLAVGVVPSTVAALAPVLPLCTVYGYGLCNFSVTATGATVTISSQIAGSYCDTTYTGPGNCWNRIGLVFQVDDTVSGVSGQTGQVSCSKGTISVDPDGYRRWITGLGYADNVSCTLTATWPLGREPFGLRVAYYEIPPSTRTNDVQIAHVSDLRLPGVPLCTVEDAGPSGVPAGSPPGTVELRSRVRPADDASGVPSSLHWNLGDGITKDVLGIATLSPLLHQYTGRGPFTVTLNATDSLGRVSPQCSTIINPQTDGIDVAVSATIPPGGLAVKASLPVTVHLTAGSKDLTGVHVAVASLPAGVLTVGEISPPIPASGLSILAGATAILTVMTTGAAPGLATLRVTATGTSSSANVTASGLTEIAVASNALRVTTATTPTTIALPVDANGRVGTRTVTVTVTLKNIGKVRLTAIKLLRLWPRPVTKTDTLDQIDFARETFPLTIGTIPPGGTVTRKLSLKLTGDGKYKVDSLSQFTSGKSTETVAGTGGIFTVTVPSLWFSAEMKGSSTVGSGQVEFVKGGRAFFLSGTVKNLSSYRHLCLWPLLPTFVGNAGGLGPADLRVYGTTEKVVPPLTGTIEPGRSVPFAMQVRTRADGGTRATVKLNPQATVIKAGAACDAVAITKTKPLTGADRIVTSGSTLLVGGVDVSVPGPEPSGVLAVAGNLAGGFTIGAISTVADTLSGTVIAAREAFSGYTQDPSLLLPTLDAIHATGAVLVYYWDTATPSEKAQLFGQVRSALRRAKGDAWKTLDQGVSASFEGFMATVEHAYATGDNRQLAYALGYGAGSTVTQIGIDMVTAEIGAGLAKKVPVLARTFSRLGGESVTFAAIKDIPPGKLLNVTEMRRLWGASLEDIAAFKRIAKEENVLIGIRSRAPISVENLNKGAVWKHENLKPKNVNGIDISWLGFERSDNGLVALKKYSTKERQAIMARINSARLSVAERAEVLDRMKTRFGEADKYLAKIEQFSKNGIIDVGFNYSENGIDAPTTTKLRNFALTGERQSTGSTYYRPWQQNTTAKYLPGSKLPKWCQSFGGRLGILCRVTGDMDGVYLSTVGGRPLPVDKLMRVYAKLALAGWQHPETFTWVEQMTGKFFFDSKEKILKGLTKGGEKLMEFAPDGFVRATWIDLNKSWFGDPRHYLVDRVGGFTSLPR